MVSRVLDRLLSAVPVWTWTAAMSLVARSQTRRFNRHPLPRVARTAGGDYVGDGSTHRHPAPGGPRGPAANSAGEGTTEPPLAVLRRAEAAPTARPVYVYSPGGGGTAGDKAALTTYCASQAASGLVGVNPNSRRAPRRD